MKALVTTAVAFASAAQLAAQGQIDFVNRFVPDDIDAPVFATDCTTLLAGDAYLAQAYVGLTVDSLAPVGRAVEFRTGERAGYITEDIVTVPAVGTVYFQMRAWEALAGPTYEEAVKNGGPFGASNPIQMQALAPPAPPGLPIGLESFCLVPEPPPMVLWLLGSSLLWLTSRRRTGVPRCKLGR